MAPLQISSRYPTWLRLLIVSAVVLSLSLVAGEDLFADHCGDHGCSGEAPDGGADCHGCLCCCPLTKMVAVVPSLAGGVEQPVSWGVQIETIDRESHPFNDIDRPPRNSR